MPDYPKNEQCRITQRAFANASASVRRLNPTVFGVGEVAASESKPVVAQALDGDSSQREGGGAGVVRVHLCAYRRRLLDDDNNTASFKPLRDAIARDFGIDDGDARIRFECSQVETKGSEGVTVKVEC